MKAEVLYGEEDWVGSISARPVIDGFDEHGFTLSVPTDRGVLTIMVSQGEPEFRFTAEDADKLRAELERLRLERTS